VSGCLAAKVSTNSCSSQSLAVSDVLISRFSLKSPTRIIGFSSALVDKVPKVSLELMSWIGLLSPALDESTLLLVVRRRPGAGIVAHLVGADKCDHFTSEQFDVGPSA
jgi:hypothetical protein